MVAATLYLSKSRKEHVMENSERATVVERLRASQERARSEGGEVGREWAKTHAGADELARLGRLWQFWDKEDALDSQTLAEEISPGLDAESFWESAGKVPGESPLWLRGFVEGALEIWNDVSSEL
jgi:hypothetical protein